MSDLISRREALEALTVTKEMDTAELLWLLTTRINDLPTITAERKTGRWIEDTKQSEKHIEKIYYCSNCHNFEAWGEYEKFNYCPNCGARMEQKTAVAEQVDVDKMWIDNQPN